MSDLDKLNKIANAVSGYIAFNNLEKNVQHKVLAFGIFESDRGNRVRVFIEGGYLILPERFDSLLVDDAYEKLNVENLYIIYSGRKGNRLLLNFATREMNEDEEGETSTET